MESLFYIDTQPLKDLPKESAWSDPDDEVRASSESIYNFGKTHITNIIQPRFKTFAEASILKCPVMPMKLFYLSEGPLVIGSDQAIKYDTKLNSYESLKVFQKPKSIISSVHMQETVIILSRKSVVLQNINRCNQKIEINARDVKYAELLQDKLVLLNSNGVVSIHSIYGGQEVYSLHLNSPILQFKIDAKSGFAYGITKHTIFSLNLQTLIVKEMSLKNGTWTCSFCLTRKNAVVGYSSGSVTIHKLSNLNCLLEVNILKFPIDGLVGDACSELFLLWNTNTKGSLRIVNETGKKFHIPSLKFKKVTSAVITTENKLFIGTSKNELMWYCII